ncbi:MAG: aspartate aminotransferase family protein [Candidatus Geothermarchaeales archaeon]
MPLNEQWLDRGKRVLIEAQKHRFPFLTEGSGSRVRDAEGNEYLDFESGQVCAALGHCHPKLVEAIGEQSGRLIHTGTSFLSVPVVELAERIAEVTPGDLKRSYFVNTGSESNEVAMKLVRRYTGKHEFASFLLGYHGFSQGSLSLTGLAWVRRGHGPFMPGVVHVPPPYCYRCFLGLEYPDCAFRCVDLIEQYLRHGSTMDIAGFFAEPILTVGGVITPPSGYFRELKTLCDEYEIPLIFDEAITGFGRTGKMFACEHYGVTPDVVTVSKALGGGLPIAAVITNEEVAEKAVENGFWHYSSHANDPLVCAAALATVNVILEEKLVENAARMGEYLTEGLMDLSKRYTTIGNVGGKGLLIGIELVKDRETREPALEKQELFVGKALENGLIVGGSRNIIRLVPPLNVAREDVDKALDILDATFKLIG